MKELHIIHRWREAKLHVLPWHIINCSEKHILMDYCHLVLVALDFFLMCRYHLSWTIDRIAKATWEASHVFPSILCQITTELPTSTSSIAIHFYIWSSRSDVSEHIKLMISKIYWLYRTILDLSQRHHIFSLRLNCNIYSRQFLSISIINFNIRFISKLCTYILEKYHYFVDLCYIYIWWKVLDKSHVPLFRWHCIFSILEGVSINCAKDVWADRTLSKYWVPPSNWQTLGTPNPPHCV